MIKQITAGIVLLSALSGAAFATDAKASLAEDFADFKPEIQFAMCRHAMQAQAAGYLRLIALEDLFTPSAQQKHIAGARTAFMKLGLSASRSWHLGSETKGAAEAFAKVLDEDDLLAEHCESWLDEPSIKKTFEEQDLEKAKASADELVDKYLSKVRANRSKSKDFT